jgi:hypothetical protein
VLGKLGEIRLWLGPYSRPQLVVAGIGLLVLGKTISWWWPVFGPLPMVGLGFAVWAVRCARIGGRVPEAAVWGWIQLAAQPGHGRIAGRPAKDRAACALQGGFLLAETDPNSDTDASPVRPSGSRPAAGVADTWRPRQAPLPSVRPARRRPQPPRRDRTSRPKAVPPDGGRAGASEAARSCRPRSSLDLLLEQAGARTPSRKA